MAAPTFMLITDRLAGEFTLPETVAAALAGGCRRVLYRCSDLNDADYIAEGKIIRNACSEYGAQFFVSRRAHLVKELQADGLHLAAWQSTEDERRLVGGICIGQSCHNDAEITRAVAEGADYITLSPIFPTSSKPYPVVALGLEGLRDMAASCPLPVYALGGVLPEFAGDCLSAGAYGIAAMGPVMRAARPAHVTADYIAACSTRPDSRRRISG